MSQILCQPWILLHFYKRPWIHRRRNVTIRKSFTPALIAETRGQELPCPRTICNRQCPWDRLFSEYFCPPLSTSFKCPKFIIPLAPIAAVGRDSSVGIANRYGLDGPGSNPDGGEIFLTRPDRPWGLPSLLYNGYRVFLGGKAAGACCWPPTPI